MYANRRHVNGATAIVIFACLTALLLLGGCAGNTNVNVKSPTNKTPDSLRNDRHSFEMLGFDAAADNASQTSQQTGSGLKVGFLYIGPAEDYGFTYAQNQGRLAVMDELGVETIVREKIPENEASINAMQEMIDEGCTVIFACSYGYQDYIYKMAEKYPDLYFFHCSGDITRENMSQYFGKIYQPRYLTGIVAGLRTQTNKIGYVAAYPIPEVIRGVDAFALGVKSVNPEAEIRINWSYSWYDPALEKDLALELIGLGCDVIAQHQDTVSPQVAAQEMGVWSIGYNSPMGFFAEDAYLTGAIWNWAPYMVDQVRNILNGTWSSSKYWGGIEDDVVRLDTLTKNVSPGAQEAVDSAYNALINGFNIFEGPIYDNEGTIRVPEGTALTDDEIWSLTWFVDNIVSTAPSSRFGDGFPY